MYKTSFKRGVTQLRLFVLVAIVGIFLAAPTFAQTIPNQDTSVAPTVVLGGGGDVFLGTSFNFTATFTNTGTETGYEPFIDLFIPPGITLSANDVTYINNTITSLGGEVIITQFPTAVSCADPVGGAPEHRVVHPLGLRQPSGQPGGLISDLDPYYLCGPAGSSVVSILLPFGSFVPGQSVELDIEADLSSGVGLDDLTIRSRGGFRRGATVANDPCCDPVIFEGHSTSIVPNWVDDAVVSPELVRVEKELANTPGAGEHEIATGPNNTATYVIRVEIAPGQTITNFNVRDLLPDDVVITGISAPGGTITPTPAYPFYPESGDDFNVIYSSANGSYEIEVDFYVPLFTNGTNSNILAETGGETDIDNNLVVTGTWNGQTFGPGNPLYICDTTCDATYRFQAKPIAIQKGGSVDTDPLQVGSIITYTLNFQVSDYFGFTDIVVTDVLGDGLQYIGNATLSIRGGAPTTITPITTPTINPTTGISEIRYEIPDLLGGCYPVDTTTDNTSTCGNGWAFGQIQFQAVVLEEYTDPMRDPAIDQGDTVVNNVTISGEILSADGNSTNGSSADGSGTSHSIPYGVLTKAVIAIDGVAVTNPDEIEPGELVTYELAYTLPTTSFEPITITDYLPLPVFEAVTLILNNATAHPAATFPGEGQWSWSITPASSSDTFHGFPTAPTASTASGNRVIFEFPAYSPPAGENFPSTLRVRFTLPTEYNESADRLLLTNQAVVEELSTDNNQNSASNIVKIELRRPVLTVKKEITTDQADLAVLDAGDVVSFEVEIANIGGRAAYDVVIRDAIAAGFDPASIANLTILDGSNNAIGYTRPDGSPATPADLFSPDGIMLIDPAGGVCKAPINGSAPSGDSVIRITYDLTVRDDVEPGSLLRNEVEVEYTNEEGGEKFDEKPKDDAETETTLPRTVAKGVIATSEAHTDYTSNAVLDSTYNLYNAPPNNTASTAEVVNGEIVRYRIVTEMRAGLYTDAHIRDVLPSGVTYLDDGTARYAWVTNAGDQINVGTSPLLNPASCTFSSFPASATLLGTTCAPSVTASGNARLFNISSSASSDDDLTVVTAQPDNVVYLVFDFNVAINPTTTGTLNNTATAYVGPEATDPVNVRVNVVRPALTIEKVITHLNGAPVTGDPVLAEAGDTVTYAIVIRNNATQASRIAYDVSLADVMPHIGQVIFDNGSLVAAADGSLSGTYVAPATGPTLTGDTINATWPILTPGQYSRFVYQVELAYTVEPTELLTNTATVDWTSLPEDGTDPNPTGSDPGTEWEGDVDDDANVQIQRIEPVKYILATSADHTEGEVPAGTGPYTEVDATIGEIVRYQLRAAIPRGTSNSFVITDQLPAGFSFIRDENVLVGFSHNTITSVVIGIPTPTTLTPVYDTNGNEVIASFVTTAPNSPSAGRETVTFNFGNVTNNTTGAGATEEVVIEFNVLVNNAATGAGAPLNQDGQAKENTFTVTIIRGGDPTSSTSDPVTVNIVEPEVTVTKRITDVNGTAVTPPATSFDDLQAGDQVEFTLTITNTGDITAYDINLTDLLPDHLTIIGGVAGGTEGTNSVTGLPEVTHYLASLAVGASHTVTYTVELDTTIPPEQDFTNTAEITWTSLEGNNGDDPNPTGSETPGDSGDDDGERNGDGGVNSYRDEDEATLTTRTFTVNKVVHDTDDTNTTGTNVAIGEEITYRLTTTVPRGTSENVTITDTLPASLEPISAEIVSISAGITNTGPLNAGDSVSASAQVFEFDFGTVVNSATADGVTETIVIDVVARVRDLVGSTAGTVINNTYTVEADGVLETTPNVPVTVVEPALTYSKAITAINGVAVTGAQDVSVGDVVTYTIVVTNTSTTAAAYDVVVTDVATFPAWLSYEGLVTPNADWAESPARTYTYQANGGVLAGGASTSFAITAEVLENAELNNSFTNTVELTYTSDPDDPTGRTYDPDPEDSEEIEVTGDFDLRKVIYATNNTDTSDPTSATYNDVALAGNSDGNARPVAFGETVTFRLVTTVPRASVPNVQLEDLLIPQISYVPNSARIAYYGDLRFEDITGAVPVIGSDGLGTGSFLTMNDDTAINGVDWVTVSSTGHILVNVGDVVWTGDASTTDDSYIVVEFEAIVTDATPTVNVGAILHNDYTLIYDDDTDNPVREDSNEVSLQIVEPALTYSKGIRSIDGDTTVTAPYTIEAGQQIIYTVTVTNTGNATAYNLSVTEGSFPTWMTYGGLVAGSAWSEIPANSGVMTLPRLDAGVSTSFDILGTVTTDAQIADDFTNSVTLVYTSDPDPNDPDGRTYTPDPEEAPEITVTGGFELDKVIMRTNQTHTGAPEPAPAYDADGNPAGDRPLTIGEEVTFRLVTKLPALTVSDLTVIDGFVDGIAYIPDSIRLGYIGNVAFGANVPTDIANITSGNGLVDSSTLTGYNDADLTALVTLAGNSIEFGFGDVVNTDPDTDAYIVIEFTAVVVNTGDNPIYVSTVWDNQYQIEYVDADNQTQDEDSNTVYFRIVEPRLEIEKSATPTTDVVSGDTIRYSLEVAHASGSLVDAFNVSVVDILPTTVTYDPATANVTVNGSSMTAPALVGQTLTFSNLGDLAVGDTITIEYTVTVNSTVTPGSAIENRATVRWTSIDTIRPDGNTRDGSNIPNDSDTPTNPTSENDYAHADETTVTASVYTGDPLKEIVSSNQIPAPSGSGQDIAQPFSSAVGDTITYNLIVPVFHGTVNRLTVVDPLVAMVEYLYDSNVGLESGVTVTTTSTDISYASYAVSLAGSNELEIEFTDVVNSGAQAYIEIEFSVLVIDTPVLATWTNQFTVTDNLTPPVPSNPVYHQRVEPSLTVEKTASVTTVGAGDTFIYTIELENIGQSTAYNVVVTDTLPMNVSYVGVVTGQTGFTTNAAGAPTLVFTLDDPMDVGDTLTIEFEVRVDPAVALGDALVNEIPVDDVDYTTHPTDGGDRNPEDPTSVTVDVEGDFELEKIIYNTTNSYTETATNRSSADLAVGETVTFRLVTRIPAASISAVSFVDTLVDGLEYVAGSARIGVIEDEDNKLTFANTTDLGSVTRLLVSDVTGNGANLADSFSTLSDFPVTLLTVDSATNAPATDVTFNIGDVVNNGTGTAFIVLEFEALVTNEAVNQNNRPFDNDYTIFYDGTEDITSPPVNLVVVEPELVVTKDATANSNFVNGGTVTYEIVVEHTATSTADAHDIVIADTLPVGFEYVTGTLNVVFSGATTPAYTDGISIDAVTGREILTVDIDGTLLWGETITITFDALISGSVQPGSNAVNDVYTTWTSDPDGNNPNRRDGDDPNDVDDHRDEDNSSNPIVEQSELEKRIAQQSQADFDAGNDYPVTIGDVFTYQLTFLVDKGNTAQIVITDQLDHGLEYVAGTLNITKPATVSYDNDTDVNLVTTFPDVAVNGNLLTVTFDNVVNTEASATTREYIVVTFDVLVVNESLNTLSKAWENTFELETSNGTDEESNPVGTIIVEPVLTIDKTVDTPTTDIVNGATVTYRLRVENTGNSIAHDVVISDTLDPALSYVGNISGANPTFSQSGQDLTFEFAQIQVGEVVEFTFDVQIVNAVQHGSDINNTAVVEWTSQPGNDPNERTGTPVDPADPNDPNTYTDDSTTPITVRELSDIEKRIGQQTESDYQAGLTHPVTIGDVLTYQLAFLVDKGNTSTIVIEDQLVDGIEFVAGSLNIAAGSVTSDAPIIDEPSAANGNKLTVTFNNVVNSAPDASTREHIVITFDVLVLNETINNTGRIWENDFDVTTPNGTTTSNIVRTEVYEPVLNITKTLGNAVPVPGANLVYTIRVEHTADSNATAYDLVVTDTLPTDLTYVAGSVTAVTGALPVVDESGLPTLTFTIDELPVGDVVEFSFEVTITGILVTGDIIENSANLEWTSQPGNDPNERDGSGINDPNDPNDYGDDDTVEATIGDPVVIEKRIAGHTQAEAEAGVPVIKGDVVTYELAVRLGKGLTSELELVDIFALGIEYDPASIVVETVGNAQVNIGAEDIDYNETTRTLTVTLTDVENTSTDTDWNEYIVVRFDVVVVDDEEVSQVGQIWENTFDLTVDDGTPKTSNPVRVEVAPYLADLSVVKSHSENRFIVDNPEPYIYSIVVSNIGGRAVENAPVIVTDDVPAPYLEVVDAEGTDWACEVTGNLVECEYTGAYPIDAGATLEPIEVSVLALEAGIFDNVVVVTAPNTEEITTDNNEDEDETRVDDPSIFDPPFGIKTVDSSNLPILEWGMVWINPESLTDGVAYKAQVVDPLPDGTTYIDGSLVCYFEDLSNVNFSTTDRCEYDPATNSVIWEGSLGASGGDVNVDTAPNRLYIVFETTLQEGIEYAENVATATYDADGDGDLTNNIGNEEAVIVVSAVYDRQPQPTILDPAIVKLVDPIFAQRGENVVWTITVSNPHGVALSNVSFTDNMPAQFAITNTSASAGQVTVEGQVIRFTIAELAAGQNVTVQVVTRLADHAELPFVVDNTAILDGPYRGQSSATVTGIAELPATGETPQILDNAIFRFIREWHSFISTISDTQ